MLVSYAVHMTTGQVTAPRVIPVTPVVDVVPVAKVAVAEAATE